MRNRLVTVVLAVGLVLGCAPRAEAFDIAINGTMVEVEASWGEVRFGGCLTEEGKVYSVLTWKWVGKATEALLGSFVCQEPEADPVPRAARWSDLQ